MKAFIYTLILILLYTHNGASQIEVAFTPSNECEDKIIRLINETEENLDIAIYAINNDNIIMAIQKAYNRGVKIRILTDRLQSSGRYSKVFDLYNYGINIKVNTKNKIEHNKFAIYDDKKVSTGSFNWTNTASKRNSENCLFLLENPEITKDYKDRFEYLWQINSKTISDEWFKKRI